MGGIFGQGNSATQGNAQQQSAFNDMFQNALVHNQQQQGAFNNMLQGGVQNWYGNSVASIPMLFQRQQQNPMAPPMQGGGMTSASPVNSPVMGAPTMQTMNQPQADWSKYMSTLNMFR